MEELSQNFQPPRNFTTMKDFFFFFLDQQFSKCGLGHLQALRSVQGVHKVECFSCNTKASFDFLTLLLSGVHRDVFQSYVTCSITTDRMQKQI